MKHHTDHSKIKDLSQYTSYFIPTKEHGIICSFCYFLEYPYLVKHKHGNHDHDHKGHDHKDGEDQVEDHHFDRIINENQWIWIQNIFGSDKTKFKSQNCSVC